MKTGACVMCGGPIALPHAAQPGRSESCPACHADLHACRQCRHYDPQAHHECREPQAEYVQDKARSNFCEYFVFRGGSGEADPQQARGAAAKQALNDLFRK